MAMHRPDPRAPRSTARPPTRDRLGTATTDVRPTALPTGYTRPGAASRKRHPRSVAERYSSRRMLRRKDAAKVLRAALEYERGGWNRRSEWD